jgi:hypothetical protein
VEFLEASTGIDYNFIQRNNYLVPASRTNLRVRPARLQSGFAVLVAMYTEKPRSSGHKDEYSVTLDQGKLREIEEYYAKCELEGANEHQIEESQKAVAHLDVIIRRSG